MKKNIVHNFILFTAFIMLLLLPIISINKESNKISETENRYLAKFPQIINDNGKINFVGLRSGIENWLNDNIGYRELFVKIKSNLTFHVLKTSPSDKVEFGKDGWYFYTMDNNLDIANGSYPLDEEILLKIKNDQEKISEYFKLSGIEYVLIFPPSKVSIYPEKIGSGNYSVRKTPVDIVSDYLEENSSVKIIRLKHDLLEAKENDQVYFKTDTHWNEVGAYVAYKSIINQMNELELINTNPVEVNIIPSTRICEFSAMMGDYRLLGAENTYETEIINPKSVAVFDSKLSNTLSYYNLNYTNFSFINNNINGKKALIFGDSMFASWNMPELLAENFSELNYVWSYQMNKEVIYQLQPQIVMYEITERYINQMVNFNQDFTFDILDDPQADVVFEDTPLIINRDQKYQINITVKNSGKENWSEDNFIRLCIWQDGIDWGYRINIPEGIEIKPGEEYTFILNDFHAPEGATTYVEYQMVQEGIKYFGEKKRVDIAIQ